MLVALLTGVTGLAAWAPPASFTPASISHADLLSGGANHLFASALADVGMVSVRDIPDYAALRRAILPKFHACAEVSHAAQSHTFDDGATRRTLATLTVPGPGGAQKLPHESTDASCADFEQTAADFRSLVADVTTHFTERLSSLLPSSPSPLLTTASGFEFPTLAAVATAGEHLEHFHAYTRPPPKSLDVAKAARGHLSRTIDTHTDQGLFIAFTPALMIKRGAPDDDPDSGTFYVELKDGSQAAAHLEPDHLIFMLGDGIHQVLPSRSGAPIPSLRAVPHSVVTPVTADPSAARVWYGRMVLPPSDALRPGHDAVGDSFGALRERMIDASLTGDDKAEALSLGCSGHHARATHRELMSCAAGSIYCWHRCMNLASHGVDNCVAPAQPQCVNGREQIYASNWHGDYWPMCTATTQQETVLREDPNSKLPQYPRNEAVCSSQEWETFSSLSGFDHVYEAPAPAGLLPDNPSLFKLMWRVEGDHVIGKMVANALFGYLSLGFRNALDLVHNGMNQAVIVHAMPGTWEGPKHGLNLSAGPKVEELYIAHTAFRQWEGPYTRPNDEAGSSLGFLHTTAVTATDCFTAVEFNASGINGTTFNLDGNDELIWAANGEDRYNGYHGRAWRATIAGLTVGSVALVGLLALAIYMVYSNLSKRRKGSGRTSDGDEAKPSPSISAAVHHGFYLAFYAWGEYIALHPKRVIGVSLAVSLVCMARLLPFFGPLANELEVENLWVPQGARAYADKLTYDAAFSTSFRRNYLYLTTKPRGGNVLASGVLQELLRLDKLIKHNVTASTTATRRGYAPLTRGGGAPLRYADVCVTRSSVSSGAVSFSAERSAVGTFGGWGSGGDETNCLEFGNPLELFYDPETDVYHLDQTDAEIAAIVDSGRGVSELLYPAWSNRTFDVSASFGGIERDAAGRVVSAKAIGIAYLTQDGPEDGAIDEAASAWEDQLNYMIDPIWSLSPPASEGSAWSNGAAGPIAFDSAVVDVFPVTSGAARQEGGKYVARDVIILTAGMGIILLYAILVLAKCHKVKGRALLAVSGCVGVGLSIGVAFSLPNILGFKTNPVVSVLPFILIGLGVDDMFVLVNAMEATPTDHTRAERLGAAMAHAGVSITITSLTDFVAFALGTMSRLPALSTFCVYAAIGIAADFLLQITFFAGFMALDMAREADGRIDCCPCAPPFKPPPAPTITTTADANAPAAATAAPSLKGCCCFPSCGCAPSHEGRLRAFIRRRYVPCLRLKAVKIALLALFVGWGAYSASCAFRLEQDFQFRWFVNDDAPLQRVFDVQDEYFNGTGMPVFAVTPPSIDDDDTGFDYASIAGQQRLLALRQELEANPWILPSSTASWYEMFREAVWKCSQTVDFTGKGPLEDYFRGKPCDRRHCDIGGQLIFPFCAHRKQLRDTNGTALQTLTSWGHSTPVLGRFNPKYLVDADGNTFDGPLESSFIPPDEFYAWLDQFVMDEILGQSVAASDIAWAVDVPVRSVLEVQQGLNATRLRANYKPVEKAATQIQSMASVRASVADARVGATTFPYTFMFLYYESYEIIISEAIMNLGLALVAVFAITLLVLADVRLTLLVMLCVVLVDIDLLGLMYLWGLTIESISIINLVLAIGLSVDYSVHLAHAFATAQGTRQERVEKALIDVGPAVLHGATSTFLAVAVLGLAQSYVFRTFFKQFFGICVFGVSHGLVLLPIMLSLVGPPAIPLADTKRSDGKPVAGDKLPPMEEDSRA